MQDNNKTDQIGNVITIYSSWKAQHRLSIQQSNLLEQKLQVKYRPTGHTEDSGGQTFNRKKQIHQIIFKSKQLIPFECTNNIEDSPRGRNCRQEDNIRLFLRKNSKNLQYSRFQSSESATIPRGTSQKIVRMHFTKSARSHSTDKDRIVTTSSPKNTHKQFRLKKTTIYREGSPLKFKKAEIPRQNAISVQRFCSSPRKEKNNFLKGMIHSDLEILTTRCQTDMKEFVIKIKMEQKIRKARAVICWAHFNYCEIQD